MVVSLQTDPVYNDPKAQNALTAAQADELRSQISPAARRSSSRSCRGRPQQQQHRDVVRYLQQNVGEPGTYAAIVGNQFRSTSQSAATNAFQTQQGQRCLRGPEPVRHERQDHRLRRDRHDAVRITVH